ncbi:MAG TPA: PASTA domain-containing protein [Gaiellaceae bacterium]|nr:PASTA domain-containing protein [Gaiellaceae bacterium]
MRPFLLLGVVIVALAATTIAWAAGRQLQSVPPPSAGSTTSKLATVVVPDVRRESFVFAKGQLQDAGFAWKVVGGVQGYPANTVVSQSPPPGVKLIDTGAPLVELTLERNKQYPSDGEPEDTSPYSPTANKLAGSD